ncbi:Peptidase M15 [Chlamydia trachomatis]|nr:Peptidase M15 [Chlamydia trachomatis]
MVTIIEKGLDKTYNIDNAKGVQNKRKKTAVKDIIYINADYGKLSQHFKAKEFQSKDGSKYLLICKELVTTLEKIREYFNAPVKINSGYRTPSWNQKVNGASNSYHCKGMAADIIVKGHTSEEVAKYANSIMHLGGIIKYTNFVHIDVREERYRKGV